MDKLDKPDDTPEQRIADLKRELRFKDERINELKVELDQQRELVRSMEEHVQERDEYLERFVTAFGMESNDDNCWTWGPFIAGHNVLVDKYSDLIAGYNKLVRAFNHNIAMVNPVGRPIAASEAQQVEITKHHRRGKSSRWIAEELSLSRRTVTTIIGKLDGSDRTTNLHRRRVGLEPKHRDWRPAAMARLPKQAAAHLEKGRELLKEAKGLK
jgi:hypothetical protein